MKNSTIKGMISRIGSDQGIYKRGVSRDDGSCKNNIHRSTREKTVVINNIENVLGGEQ
jgi:hypothetical protein